MFQLAQNPLQVYTEEIPPDRKISDRANIPSVTPGADFAHNITIEEGNLEAIDEVTMR